MRTFTTTSLPWTPTDQRIAAHIDALPIAQQNYAAAFAHWAVMTGNLATAIAHSEGSRRGVRLERAVTIRAALFPMAHTRRKEAL
jgi:hypothetical protein